MYSYGWHRGSSSGLGFKERKEGEKISPTEIKQILIEKKSGGKCDPEDVVSEMKRLRNSYGNCVFLICYFLNSSQIASFFSRLVMSSKKFNKSEVADEDSLAAAAAAAAEIDQSAILSLLQVVHVYFNIKNCDFHWLAI